jgi:hypothetical protein
MKIAIMQPYFLPYLGYFQLFNAVDKFVIGDDYKYILQGWINRNKILVNGKEFMFTIPLRKASPNKLIKEVEICNDTSWQEGFLKTIKMAYGRAPFYNEVFLLLNNIIMNKEINISKLIFKSLYEIKAFLGIKTIIVETQAIYNNKHLEGQERIIDTCKKENAASYLNLIGGVELYSKERFEKEGIALNYINSKSISYHQFGAEYVPNLSIIDVLMFNSKEKIREYLNSYKLI